MFHQPTRYALFFLLLSIYLLTYTPRINSSDGLAMFATAESLVRRGAVAVEQIRWMDLQQGSYGLDGLLYSRKGIGLPLAMLPLTWLGWVSPIFGPVNTSLLFNALVTALTAVLLMAYLQQRGFSERTGLLVALTFGLATLAWPYAKSLFSDPFSGLLLLAAALCLGVQQTKERSDFQNLTALVLLPFLAGLFLAWNVATRYAEAIFIPMVGLYLLMRLGQRHGWQSWPRFIKPCFAFLLPILAVGFMLMTFNLMRYGHPLDTGYLASETFSEPLWRGLSGQLLSPGRGLLLYCPILLLSVIGLWPCCRRFPLESGLALSIILVHLLLYSKWFMWHGGYAWGPRFLIPTLPFWVMFLAPIAELFEQSSLTLWQRGLKIAYLILFGLSLIPQLLTVTLDFSPVQNALLDTGLPLFAPATFFEWQHSPFVTAWSFISWQQLDWAWAWQGELNGWLLGLLLLNLLTCSFVIRVANRSRLIIATITTLIAVTLLLRHAHTLSPHPIPQIADTLNRYSRVTDAILINNPDWTAPFADPYRGRSVVVGLNTGQAPLSTRLTTRLTGLMAAHEQIWWLPNGLPPNESGVEQQLLAHGFKAHSWQFEAQRLVLFAFPKRLPRQPLPAGTTFFEAGPSLAEVRYAPSAKPGRAWAIEFHWQTAQPLSTDYHLFIHGLDEQGQLQFQADGQPVHWTRPTTSWTVQETIIDRWAIWLPTDLPVGAYRLKVGWYQPETGQRLGLTTGQDGLPFQLVLLD